ncbi:TPA: methyl-accepting chemotaxis protein [Enterobacter hormaechei subsp. steigerwaltii]|nr:methyl-accepting chemotaxis protein [Enterobacter hormaechei subsp. steigerwaltii]
MSTALNLKNLSVTRKLSLGFGLLLSFALLLALVGFYGLQNSSTSLQRISQLGGLFDEIVFTREANFNYALSGEDRHLDMHKQHLQALQEHLAQLLDNIQNGRWPSQDLDAAKGLQVELDGYSEARKHARTEPELIAANERLSNLQNNANVLYLAEETRASQHIREMDYMLIGITLLAMIAGALIAVGISRQIVLPLCQAVQAAQRIASGDLTQEMHITRGDELGTLLNSLGTMNLSLRTVISQIGSSAHQLAASASQLASITNQTQIGIDSQRNETDMVATAMNEMAATVQEVARHSEEAAIAARGADQEASNALEQSQQAISQIEKLSQEIGISANSMGRLQHESERIAGILDVIKAVAEQTNLLALNAAIEAARAGEAGRGFAVVADEVRNLAQRTQQSSSEIEQLIAQLRNIADESTLMMQASVEQTQASVTGVRDTGTALEAITRQVSNIQQMGELIATAAEEQSAVAEEINRSVTRVRATAEESATASAEISAASSELERLGNELNVLVGHFRT